MRGTQSQTRKQRLHEEWLSRGAYDECFRSQEPPVIFKRWRGNPDPCGCGCGEVMYSKSNPQNLWASLSPDLLWKTGFLFPVFLALTKTLWYLPGFLSAIIRSVLTAKGFGNKPALNPKGQMAGRSTVPLRFLGWASIRLLLYLLLMAVWVVCRFSLVLLVPLYILGMALELAVMLLDSALAVIRLASIGLLFLIGAAASFAFEASPVLGISLIVAGVCFEYENRRQRERQNREQLGRLLRIIGERGGQ